MRCAFDLRIDELPADANVFTLTINAYPPPSSKLSGWQVDLVFSPRGGFISAQEYATALDTSVTKNNVTVAGPPIIGKLYHVGMTYDSAGTASLDLSGTVASGSTVFPASPTAVSVLFRLAPDIPSSNSRLLLDNFVCDAL